MGTLWTNMWLFTNINGLFGALNSTTPQPLAERMIVALSQGKFLALLSLIFGVGLALQLDSARRRNQRWPGPYIRRMLLLLLDGAINFLLIAEFDVLMGYAITGLIVSYLVLTKPRTQRIAIITLGTIHVALLSLIAWAAEFYSGGTGDIPTSAHVNTPYAHGSFLDLVLFRLNNAALFRSESILIAALTIAMFLLGVRLYEARVFNPEATSLRKKLLLIGAVALPIDLALGIAGNTGLVLLERYVVAPFTAMGLLALIIEACQRLGTTNLTGRLLQNVGRTALSCYLLQNLLGGIFFYRWGFGLVNHVQSWRIPATMLGYIVIAAAVVMFANLWLRRFSTGPVEWLWKKMAQL